MEENVQDVSIGSEIPGSLLEELRSLRDEGAKERTLDVDSPGLGGRIFVRFGAIPWEEARKIIGRAAGRRAETIDELNAQADLLIRCCRGVYARHEKREVLLADGFNASLADLLDVSGGSARKVLFGVFGMRIGPDRAAFAVTDVHVELWQWLTAANRDMDEEAVGE